MIYTRQTACQLL